MSLEMRGACEKCGKTTPHDSAEVYICSFECTWCGSCAEAMSHACPNCGGELLRRPRRAKRD
jgi:hypothetical protein